MYCRAFACDFDGAGASNRRLAPEIAAVLAAARSRGYATLLVTGRVLEELQAAEVEELHRSARNMIAFGDAENDRPLLETAEVGIAARGSVASIAAAADDRLSQPGAAGVAHYIQGVIDRSGQVATPPRQRIHLGTDDHGGPVFLPASVTNVMISGDPRSGKSRLGGLVAERLIERGYRLCIIDPEGDYPPLGQRPQGDFSRWATGVLGDSGLAAVFRKLEQTTRVGAPPSRHELLAHVKDLYVIGERLGQPKGAQ